MKNTEIVSGKEYLIGQSSYVLVNSQSTASGTPTGLAMKAADLESDDQSAYMWTVKAVDGGYTIQDVNGKYLSFNGSNVGLSDTAQTLTVGNGASDGFGISYGGQYLNNYGRSNTKVAGYSANDNDWYLFAPETGYFVTAEKAGTTTVVIGGVTYEIVVTETVTECKHENTERVGVKDPTCTEPGSTGKLVCKDCNETLEEATEIAATGHSYGEWTVVKAATTEEEGLEKRVCEKCDAEQTRSIPKLENRISRLIRRNRPIIRNHLTTKLPEQQSQAARQLRPEMFPMYSFRE